MSNVSYEIEVKFHIAYPQMFTDHLHELGAEIIRPRHHENNLRLDFPDGRLGADRQILRLRKDDHAWLTFKGPADISAEVVVRPEYEVQISDFDTMQTILRALGFQTIAIYEKFRTMWRLDDVIVTLDEMPYGFFSELEGPGEDNLKVVADKLGLNWQRRCLDSYLGIFGRLADHYKWDIKGLTFNEFDGKVYSLDELDILPADRE